jgi:RNA-directed DNA polymerase
MENINSWNEIKWSIVDQTVFRLQLRIYKAATEKKLEKMYKLQKTLVSSKFAKYLAVRKVTQDKTGKGVDPSPKEKFDLANNLLLNGTKRTYLVYSSIKPEDRAKQMLAYLAMCPQWEAHFEANSYGFRPGKSVKDAMEAVFLGIAKKPKWVLNTYISKCFDEINQQYLLEKCETYPQMQKQIRAWLKAGILYGGEYAFPEMGTLQGGIISALLVNIALHGMREYIINTLGPNNLQTTTFVRYADNFVIMHPHKEVILQLREVIQEFLKPIGLKLNPIKTRIFHTLNAKDERLPGFTFIGFDVIQRQKRLRQFTDRNSKQDYITFITPSKKAIQAHRLKVREIIRQYRGVDQENLIKKLNSIIRGWTLSKGSQIASKIFQDLDAYLWLHLWKWGRKRHPKMSKIKLKEKYWHKVSKENWVFGVKDNKGNVSLRLHLHSKIRIKPHIKLSPIYSSQNE